MKKTKKVYEMNKAQEEAMNNFITKFEAAHIINEMYSVKSKKSKVGKEYTSFQITVGKENGFDRTSTILIDKQGMVRGYNNQLQTIYGIEANLYQ